MSSTLQPVNASSTHTPIVPCDGFGNVDYSGLNGTVCGALIEPDQLNISSCCTGEIQVVNNCSQHCETNSDDFGDCVNDLWDGGHVSIICEEVNGSEGQANSSASAGSPTATDGPESPPESTGAGKFHVSLVAREQCADEATHSIFYSGHRRFDFSFLTVFNDLWLARSLDESTT